MAAGRAQGALLGMAAAASGAASSARPPSGFTFDPANALPWAVPMLLIAPFATFLLALSSVRTRRSASAMAMFGSVVTLLLTLLVAWGLTRKSSTFVATYHYFTMSVAFSGPSNFQTFAIDLALRVDHLTVVALVAIEVCVIGAIGWHQVMGRAEPGAARFHAVVTALVFACAGTLMSTDLAEMFAFWAIGGALSYLLLAHRWGVAEAAMRSRVVLALPFITDLSFFCGIGWFYARYGTQTLSSLIPILHTNPGWTVRSIVVGSVLLFIGVVGRLALWPFSAWVTSPSVSAPPAASAIVQSTWSIVAIAVLYRLMPIFVASSRQALEAFTIACAVAAVAAGVLALLGNEPRRIVTLAGAGSAAVAAGVVFDAAFHHPAAFGASGVAAVIAMAPARAAALLAASTIVAAIRSEDLADMGEAWRRMRASSGALLVASIVIGLAATGALAYGVGTRSRTGLVLGEAVLLVSVGVLRVFLGSALGPLRRRRAFDPERVREPQGALGWPYGLAALGVAFLVASLITGWLSFLDGNRYAAAPVTAIAIWSAVALAGFAACAGVYARGKDGALAASALGGRWVWRGTSAAYAAADRFLFSPTTDLARRLGDWVPAGDGALGRLTTMSGQVALGASRAPAIAAVLVLSIVLALFFALVVPGVAR